MDYRGSGFFHTKDAGWSTLRDRTLRRVCVCIVVLCLVFDEHPGRPVASNLWTLNHPGSRTSPPRCSVNQNLAPPPHAPPTASAFAHKPMETAPSAELKRLPPPPLLSSEDSASDRLTPRAYAAPRPRFPCMRR